MCVSVTHAHLSHPVFSTSDLEEEEEGEEATAEDLAELGLRSEDLELGDEPLSQERLQKLLKALGAHTNALPDLDGGGHGDESKVTSSENGVSASPPSESGPRLSGFVVEPDEPRKRPRIRKKRLICMRCHRLKNHRSITPISLDDLDFQYVTSQCVRECGAM